MENREIGIEEIIGRLTASKDTLGLNYLKRSPTRTIDKGHLPCIFIVEGPDNIIKYSNRGTAGYPARRMVEVILEIIASDQATLKQLYSSVRGVVFGTTPTVAPDSFIKELRAEGPMGYGVPDVLGMRFILGLTYTDSGN